LDVFMLRSVGQNGRLVCSLNSSIDSRLCGPISRQCAI
jgi:hypothetical protein